MMHRFILLFFIAALFFCPKIFAQSDNVTITTYYPSPHGVYFEMRSKKMAIGENLYQSGLYPFDEDGFCQANEICDADLAVEGNVYMGGNLGIGSSVLVGSAPKGMTIGNLNVNDVYLRSMSRWLSEGNLQTTIVPGPQACCDSRPGMVCNQSQAACPVGYKLVGGGHLWRSDFQCEEKYRFITRSRPINDMTWEVEMACSCFEAYAVCARG